MTGPADRVAATPAPAERAAAAARRPPDGARAPGGPAETPPPAVPPGARRSAGRGAPDPTGASGSLVDVFA